MDSDEIKARLKALRRKRREDMQRGTHAYQIEEQKLHEELLDIGLCLHWIRNMQDYGVFCNEEE